MKQRVDAVTKYYIPLPSSSQGASIAHYGLFSDSTLVTQNRFSFHAPLVADLRGLRQTFCTLDLKIKGGYTLRQMARDLADAHEVGEAPLHTLVCIYQISDRAWVAESTGVATVQVKQTNEWKGEIELFCEVARLVASNVVVVTSEASCFPRFHAVSAAYDENVLFLRRILKSCGVSWC